MSARSRTCPTHGPFQVKYLMIVLLILLAASPASQAPAIIGSWRGTSKCVDLAQFPACHDEVVIYDIRPIQTTADTVMLRADKVVNGKREFMFELPFARQTDGSWSSEFEGPRAHGRWVLHVRTSSMTGELLDLPESTLVRRMSLMKVAPA